MVRRSGQDLPLRMLRIVWGLNRVGSGRVRVFDKCWSVTVGTVPPWCGFSRGNRSEGCCGRSEMTVENRRREGLLW